MKLFLKLINNKNSDLYNNEKNFTNDAGYDLYCVEEVTVKGGSVGKVKLGIIGQPEIQNQSYMLFPRSSIYKTPLRLVNSVGIIDKDYRGELKAPLQNNPNVSTYLVDFTAGVDVVEKYTYSIESYSRLVQICAPDLSPLSMAFVNELDDTSRGSGGFGSTGI